MPRLHMMQGFQAWLLRGSRGGVALLFGILCLPLILLIGLAIDYAAFIKTQAQLSFAADTAAMHAVRIASQAYAQGQGQTTTASSLQAGQVAGQQWFAVQVGQLLNASVTPTVNVTYTASPSAFSATVNYSGNATTYFGTLFGVRTFALSGTATAVISNAYVEVLLLLDNSPSMLLGSTLSDITTLEQATICNTRAKSGQIDMSQYTWIYPTHTPKYGFASGDAIPPAAVSGSCDSRYTGNPQACFYPMLSPFVSAATGACTNGGGASGGFGANTPQTPCGFACHSDANNNDNYGLARSIGITLRLDVVQQAAANVVSTLQNSAEFPNQFSIGVYQFASGLSQLFPTSSTAEASNDLATALATVQNVHNTPPLTSDLPDTNFPNAAQQLAAHVGNGGDGSLPTAPQKNIFIVTDGMDDVSSGGSQVLSPMTSASNETICQLFKKKGFTVYVLYTPYLPVPVASYLRIGAPTAEPTNTSANVQALQACASRPADFFQASDSASINTAMQAMLAAALNTPGRIAQ